MSFDTWENELYHHGIKGQKWGVRRYQNEDGSLTEEGLKRYGRSSSQKEINVLLESRDKKPLLSNKTFKKAVSQLKETAKNYRQLDKQYQKEAAPLYKNRKLFDKYSKKALGADDSDLDWFWNHPVKIAQTQSYLKDKNQKLLKQHTEAWKQYENKSKQTAYELLGRYGDTPVYTFDKKYKKADQLALYLRKQL